MTEDKQQKRTQPTKTQGVLTPELREQLDNYKAENEFKNDGEALRHILSAFFNGDADNYSGGNTEHLEQRITSLEQALYHDDMDIPERANKAYENYAGLDDALNSVADTQREQNAKIRDLEKQIQELKNSLENNISKDINEISKTTQENSEDISEISVEKEPVKAVENTTNDDGEKPTEKTKEIPEELKQGLSGMKLGERLGVSSNAIGKQRDKGEESFKNWSQKKDPKDIAWWYDPNDGTWGKYHPIN